jgi:hypothetical protein
LLRQHRIAQLAHFAFQLRDLAMRGVHLGARRHAELAGRVFDFALHATAHAHLRIDEAAIDLAEFIRQRDLRIRFFGRVDPQVEHRTRGLELLSVAGARGELFFEHFVRTLARLHHQCVVGAVFLLQVELRLHELLPTLLVFARETEGRHAEPRTGFTTPGIEERRGIFDPLVQALLALAAHRTEQFGERVLADRTERRLPRIGDVARRASDRELRGHLLHRAVPAARLAIEAIDRGIDLRALAVGELGPPVHRVVPLLHRVRRGGLGRRRRATKHVAPCAPVLPCHLLEILPCVHPCLPCQAGILSFEMLQCHISSELGIFRVLLIISEPDSANTSTSGCSCHGPRWTTPNHRSGPMRPWMAATGQQHHDQQAGGNRRAFEVLHLVVGARERLGGDVVACQAADAATDEIRQHHPIPPTLQAAGIARARPVRRRKRSRRRANRARAPAWRPTCASAPRARRAHRR